MNTDIVVINPILIYYGFTVAITVMQ